MTASEEQLSLEPAHANQGLFSDHFLHDRLPDWPEFANVDVAGGRSLLSDLWKGERDGLRDANEPQTEERFVQPVLCALGFSYTVQVGLAVASSRRQPDYALFLTDDERRAAGSRPPEARFANAVAVADAKRFGSPLDRRRAAGALSEDPVGQIIHYVAVTPCRWGILTNGGVWRLYAADRNLLGGAHFEVDLVTALERGDDHSLRLFLGLFSASAFRSDSEGRSFLKRALDESKQSARRVGAELERQVFDAVPLIAEGLLGDETRSPASLAAAFEHSLVLLYRLLFCLQCPRADLQPPLRLPLQRAEGAVSHRRHGRRCARGVGVRRRPLQARPLPVVRGKVRAGLAHGARPRRAVSRGRRARRLRRPVRSPSRDYL
jgi:hypothetical protein